MVNKMNNKRFEIGASEQPLDIIKETCGFAGIFKGDRAAQADGKAQFDNFQRHFYTAGDGVQNAADLTGAAGF